MSISTKITQKKAPSEKSIFRKQENSKNGLNKQNSSAQDILALHQTIGNQAVQRLFKSGFIQGKLTIGEPNDKYEKEADEVADQVMRMPEPQVQRQNEEDEEEEMLQTKPIGEQITPFMQRQPEEEEEELLQAKAEGQTPKVAPNLESSIHALQGGGQPLSKETRNFFEPRFGQDFSNVKVHNDSNANQLARSINARAFTKGSDIVFGDGEYRPGSSNGKRLLGHELTHVVQQNVDKVSSVSRQSKQPEEIKVYRHGGYQFHLNFSFLPKKEGDNSELFIVVKEFLRERRIYNLNHQVAISNSIRDCTEQAGLKYEMGQAYNYRIAIKFVNGEIDWLRIILTKPITHTYEYEKISSYGQGEEQEKEELLKSEDSFKGLEDTNEILQNLDTWLARGQSVSKGKALEKLTNIKENLKKISSPLNTALDIKKKSEKVAELMFILQESSKIQPGSEGGVKAAAKIFGALGQLGKEIPIVKQTIGVYLKFFELPGVVLQFGKGVRKKHEKRMTKALRETVR